MRSARLGDLPTASRESKMYIDDQDFSQPDPSLSDLTWAPTPITPTLQSSKEDVGLNGLTGSQTPPGFRPL
jgi:hypothetical protein